MRLIPRSFLWRTILMILIPLIVALVIIANVFFGNHWSRVHATLARSLAVDISTMMNFMDNGDMATAQTMARDMGINISINPKLNRPNKNDNASREAGLLANELATRLNRQSQIYIDKAKRLVFVDIPTNNGQIATFGTSLYRIYSTSTEVFIIWLIGSILIVSILVTPFIIMHTRIISLIAKAAGRFCRCLDAPGFVPTCSKDIR